MEKIQREMYAIQGNISYMLSDRYHLYDLVHIFHVSSLKDDQEICKLSVELMATQDSLTSTQSYLLEFIMEIEKLHQ